MGISIKDSVMYPDIQDIIGENLPGAKYNPSFEVEIKLHTEEKNLDQRDGVTLIGITTFRDYVSNVSDYIEAQLSISLGTFVYDVYPYLNNMELTIYKNRQTSPDGIDIVNVETYKVVYLLERNHHLPSITSVPRETLDQELPISLHVQLIDRSTEAIRIKTISGSFGNDVNDDNTDMSIKAFMKSLLSSNLDMIQVAGKPAIDRLDIEDPDNEDDLLSITIPTGTRLVELPEFLQTRSDGVYSSGIGNYIQNYSLGDYNLKCFFVYSLYNAEKFHEAKNRIIFYSPPTSSLSIGGKTYMKGLEVMKVLVDTTTSLSDTKESLVMSTGIGFRTSAANSIMKKPTVVTPDGPQFEKTEMNTEVIYRERDDGINFAPYTGISSNVFENSSKVLAKTGTYVTLTANSLDLDYLYPGAACKVVYESQDDGIEELYGVIHRIRCSEQQPNFSPSELFKNPEIQLSSSMEIDIFITG